MSLVFLSPHFGRKLLSPFADSHSLPGRFLAPPRHPNSSQQGKPVILNRSLTQTCISELRSYGTSQQAGHVPGGTPPSSPIHPSLSLLEAPSARPLCAADVFVLGPPLLWLCGLCPGRLTQSHSSTGKAAVGDPPERSQSVYSRRSMYLLLIGSRGGRA